MSQLKQTNLTKIESFKTEQENKIDLSYPREYERHDKTIRYMDEIHQMAVTGKSIISAMGTSRPMPNWDDILILGAQFNPPPLDEHAHVYTTTVIGKTLSAQWS